MTTTPNRPDPTPTPAGGAEEALERLAIALDEDRAQDPDADLPFVCDRRDVEALLGELAALREDKADLDILSLPTTSDTGTVIGVGAPGSLPGASLYYDGDTDAWDGATLRDCIKSMRAARATPTSAAPGARGA